MGRGGGRTFSGSEMTDERREDVAAAIRDKNRYMRDYGKKQRPTTENRASRVAINARARPKVVTRQYLALEKKLYPYLRVVLDGDGGGGGATADEDGGRDGLSPGNCRYEQAKTKDPLQPRNYTRQRVSRGAR